MRNRVDDVCRWMIENCDINMGEMSVQNVNPKLPPFNDYTINIGTKSGEHLVTFSLRKLLTMHKEDHWARLKEMLEDPPTIICPSPLIVDDKLILNQCTNNLFHNSVCCVMHPPGQRCSQLDNICPVCKKKRAE